ncbi:MAG: hypothetical protein ABIU77_03215, partial [Ferruginibacter sp.]
LAPGFKKPDGPQIFINAEFFFFHMAKLSALLVSHKDRNGNKCFACFTQRTPRKQREQRKVL